MSRGTSPLVGYNTNVRHKGKLYHIQTEDSGVKHPHIITHLFADGGRIIASKKTDYAQYLGSATLPEIVKRLMQEQHKAMFIALRDCVYDEDAGAAPALAQADKRQPAETPVEAKAPELDLDALERAAEARIAQSTAAKAQADARNRGAGRYKQTVPAQSKRPPKPRSKTPDPQASIFGGKMLRSKSLDEVILSYLADDSTDDK
jgi:hypothetical protein